MSFQPAVPLPVAEEDEQVREILADPEAYFEEAYRRALYGTAQEGSQEDANPAHRLTSQV
ncbi:hypothetical protein [Streptomyces sp. NBC_01262]|uniref:hypothetical protein n=1 Tax=Streptomyces sp. NBC_01262 TaxID=2903803 RepID=UPI002E338D6E|nr:hypothetical protein [Streptomyces sp. NBC_01262]